MIVKCAGCDAPIHDKFLMTVLDQKWHSDCVTCCFCQSPLVDKCFSKGGRLFCKEDFLRIFGTKCAGCDQVILPQDLVRRARDRIYHVTCFICVVCKRELDTGEELYVISDLNLLCAKDYSRLAEEEQAHEEEELHEEEDQSGKDFIDDATDMSGHVEAWAKMEEGHCEVKSSLSSSSHHNQHHLVNKSSKHEDMNGDEDYDDGHFVSCWEDSPPSSPGNSVDPRPRDAPGDPNHVKGEAIVGSIEGHVNNVGKRRGPRTTIKAKQLETLKNAFANTPKPTRHIREQLAQETGLNMRVIQVWFQNRRSKERRMKQFNAQGMRRNFFRNPRRVARGAIGETTHPHLLLRDFFMKGDEAGEFMVRSIPCNAVQSCYPETSDLYDPHHMYGGPDVLYPDFYSSIGLNHVSQAANQMSGLVHPLSNQRISIAPSSLVSANQIPNLELISAPIATARFPTANKTLPKLIATPRSNIVPSHLLSIKDQSQPESPTIGSDLDQSEMGLNIIRNNRLSVIAASQNH